MGRRRTLSGALAVLALAVLAGRSVHAEPPMVRAPGPQVAQPAPRPGTIPVVDPHAAAILRAAQQSASSVSAHPSLIDPPKASLQPYEKADGPTLVLTATAPVVPGKARLYVASSAAQIQWDTDIDAIVLNYDCPMNRMGMTQNACAYNFEQGTTVIAAQVNADNAHGYLINCFVNNAGPGSAVLNGQTVGPGHGAWLSSDIKPGAMVPGWGGGGNGMMIFTTPPGSAAYIATLSLTRCEVTPYTVPQPPSPSAGH
jgi:hypothetical protein